MSITGVVAGMMIGVEVMTTLMTEVTMLVKTVVVFVEGMTVLLVVK